MAKGQRYDEGYRAANQKWDAAHLDRISIALPKGYGERLKLAAQKAGKSRNQLLVDAATTILEQYGIPKFPGPGSG